VSVSGTMVINFIRLKAYSYSLTVFSPSGKLVQIEHALAAVSQGTTSLGIKGAHPLIFLSPNKSANPPFV
jgi:20S proteasome subunit alpha 2